jgi:hypothetical protein
VVWKGIIAAPTKKDAKANLNDLFDADLKQKVSEGKNRPEFKLFLIELTEEWERFWCDTHTCKICKTSYSIIVAYQAGEQANKECCSAGCSAAVRKPFTPEFMNEGYENVKPCIYKITNRQTKMSYIGKTTRPVTLRWWQHFSQTANTKFHKVIEVSSITDWTFEVVEVLEIKSQDPAKMHREILIREQYWIDKLGTITDGYNSVASLNLDSASSSEEDDPFPGYLPKITK